MTGRLELEVAPAHRVSQDAFYAMTAYMYQHTVAPPENPLHEERAFTTSLRSLIQFNRLNGIEVSRPQVVRLLVLAAQQAREACELDGVELKVPPRLQDLSPEVWQYIAPYFEVERN